MNASRRLARLEELWEESGCDVCTDEFEVSWDFDEPDTDESDAEEKLCPSCGRQLVFVITWGEGSS